MVVLTRCFLLIANCLPFRFFPLTMQLPQNLLAKLNNRLDEMQQKRFASL